MTLRTPNADSRLHENTIRLARVAEVHPHVHAVDVVFLDDGSYHMGVKLLNPMASQQYGMSGLSEPESPPNGKWDPLMTERKDMLCVVAFTDLMPVVLGFVHPEVGGMGFEKEKFPDLAVDKHASGTYTAIYGDGTHETKVPKRGITVSMRGMGAAPPSLVGQDFDGQFELPGREGLGEVLIEVAGGSRGPSYIRVLPSSVIIHGPCGVFVSNSLFVEGKIVASGDVMSQGGDISLTEHIHCGVQSGGSCTLEAEGPGDPDPPC
jgi:hypothetical protein